MDTRSEEVRAAYDATAEAYAAAFPTTEPEHPLDLAMVDDLVARVLAGGGRQVLDAGCGTGRMSRYLADRGCSVRGVDLSPGMLAVARREHPSLSFAEGSLTALPVGDASVDGVLAWYSVIHLTDDELPVALGEMRRVLRPGGYLLLASQKGEGEWDVGERLRALGHDVRLVRHHRGPRVLLGALAAAGFARQARVVREPVGQERVGQVVVLARRE